MLPLLEPAITLPPLPPLLGEVADEAEVPMPALERTGAVCVEEAALEMEPSAPFAAMRAAAAAAAATLLPSGIEVGLPVTCPPGRTWHSSKCSSR